MEETEKDLVSDESKYVELCGVNVHYKEWGDASSDGPTLIMLHGFGQCVETWRPVRARLAEKYHIIAYDRPACGLTSRPKRGRKKKNNVWGAIGENPYTLEFSVKLLEHLAKEKAKDKIVLVSHSAGGVTILSSLLTSEWLREHVVAVVLEHAPANTSGTPAFVRVLWPWLSYPLLPVLGLWVKSYFPKQMKSMCYDTTKIEGWDEFMVDQDLGLRQPGWETAMNEFTMAQFGTPIDLRPQIKEAQFQIPILLLAGVEDTIVKLDEQKELLSLLPNGRLVEFEECGHLSHTEKPEEYLTAVLDFLEEVLKED